MGRKPEELETGFVASSVRTTNDENHFNPKACESVGRLDGLDAVRPLHGKPDVGEVEDLHEGSGDFWIS
jgi:hypothetical protein